MTLDRRLYRALGIQAEIIRAGDEWSPRRAEINAELI